MNNSNPLGTAPSPAYQHHTVLVHTPEGHMANAGAQTYIAAKRTAKSSPSYAATGHCAPLPSVQSILSSASSVPAPVAGTREMFYRNTHVPPPVFESRQYYAAAKQNLPQGSRASSELVQNTSSWPSGTPSPYQSSAHLRQQSPNNSQSRYSSQTPGAAGTPNDHMYEFTFSAPITRNPRALHHVSQLPKPVEAAWSHTARTPRSQPSPAHSSWNRFDRRKRQVFIDLTQDDSAPSSRPSTSAKDNTAAVPQEATAGPHIEPQHLNTTSITVGTGTKNELNLPPASPSDISSDLSSTTQVCEVVVRDIPHVLEKGPAQLGEFLNDPKIGLHHPPTSYSADTAATASEAQNDVDSRASSHRPLSSAGMRPPTLSRALNVNVRSRKFDSSAFDTAIYQQPGAAHPPTGVAVAQRIVDHFPDEDQRQYIYANPAIHGMHNRPEAWYARKALEIQSRGGRKFWFGKASARMRWLQKKRAESSKAHGIFGDALPERSDPQPRAYARPLDFGDVPEGQLPEDVRQNEGWLKACEWFREQQSLHGIRLRESKRCEQEANDYYNMMVFQGGSSL